MEKTTAIVAAPQAPTLSLIPYASEEMERAQALTMNLAKALPGDGRKDQHTLAGEYMVAILAGRELGWDMMRAIRSFSVIKGRATLNADAMGGLVMSHPDCEYLTFTHADDKSATCEIKRKGAPQPLSVTFSLEDAKKAGLYPGRGRSPWTTYTRDMLRKSAMVRACRWAFPDAVGGFYDPDEIGAPQSFDGRPQRQTTRPPQPQRAPVLDVVPESVKPQPVAPPVYPEDAPLLGRFLALFDGLLRDGQVMDLYDHYYDVDLTTVGEEYLRTEGKALQDDRTELERRVAAYRVGKSLSAPPPAMGPVAEPAPQEAPGSLAGEAHRLLSELAQLREAASIDALIDLYVKEGPDLTRAPLDVIRQEVLIRRTIATKGQPSSDVAPIPAPAQESLLPAQPKVDTAAEWRRAFDAIVACFDGHSGKSVMSIFKVDDVDLNACTTERLRWIHRQLDPGTVQGLIGRSMGTTTEVQSSSDPDVSYTVTERGGAYSCTCDGYRYRQACRHIDKVKGAGSE